MANGKLELLRLNIIQLHKGVVSDTSLQPNSKIVIDLLCRMTEYGSTGLTYTSNRAVIGSYSLIVPDDEYQKMLQLAVDFCADAKKNEGGCVASLCASLSDLLETEPLSKEW